MTFDGRRDSITWAAQTLGAGWAGDGVLASRDRRTVSVDVDVTKASWTAGLLVATLDPSFWPSTTPRHLPVMNRGDGTVNWLLIDSTNGEVTVIVAGSAAGLIGCVTFLI